MQKSYSVVYSNLNKSGRGFIKKGKSCFIRPFLIAKCVIQNSIAFAPKYRRQEIYGKRKADTGTILRKLCGQKDAEIIEAQACPGHIRIPVSIPPKLSAAQIAGYVKGKSALVISDRHANLRNKCGNGRF